MLYRDHLKRAFDFVGALMLLVLLTPVLAPLGLMLLLAHHPVLFRQERLGLNGRTFQIYKLRTMWVNSDQTTPCVGTTDVRITPIGHYLRALRLDELPQLFNVLRGDMSLVGPRPEAPSVGFDLSAQSRDDRLQVRPGITGLAKIHRPNQGINDLESLVDDAVYAVECSFRLDLMILLLTIPAAIRGALEHRSSQRSELATK